MNEVVWIVHYRVSGFEVPTIKSIWISKERAVAATHIHAAREDRDLKYYYVAPYELDTTKP